MCMYSKKIVDAKFTARQVTAMGISTQRSTFITWSRSTGKPFHRFITWKDIRADELVRHWNNSFTWKVHNINTTNISICWPFLLELLCFLLVLFQRLIV